MAQKKYKEMLNIIRERETSFLNECLSTIVKTIKENGGELEFGNTHLKVENDVAYIAIDWDKVNLDYVPLYSEDGYDTIEDIANWADICEDVVACYKSGKKGYSVMWNVK